MNMNMKNEKTMLALVLVAALAMVSVAGVALASESDGASVVLINNDQIIDSKVDTDLNVYVPFTAGGDIIGGTFVMTITSDANYTGTIQFGTWNAQTNAYLPAITLNLAGVSSAKITFTATDAVVNLAVIETITDTNMVASTTGTITVSAGIVQLGSTNYFSGTVVAGDAKLVSENTYGAGIDADGMISGQVHAGSQKYLATYYENQNATSTKTGYKTVDAKLTVYGTATIEDLTIGDDITSANASYAKLVEVVIDADAKVTLKADVESDFIGASSVLKVQVSDVDLGTDMYANAAIYDSLGQIIAVTNGNCGTDSGSITFNVESPINVAGSQSYTMYMVLVNATSGKVYYYLGTVTFDTVETTGYVAATDGRTEVNVVYTTMTFSTSEVPDAATLSENDKAGDMDVAGKLVTENSLSTLSYNNSKYTLINAFTVTSTMINGWDAATVGNYNSALTSTGKITFNNEISTSGTKLVVLMKEKDSNRFVAFMGTVDNNELTSVTAITEFATCMEPVDKAEALGDIVSGSIALYKCTTTATESVHIYETETGDEDLIPYAASNTLKVEYYAGKLEINDAKISQTVDGITYTYNNKLTINGTLAAYFGTKASSKITNDGIIDVNNSITYQVKKSSRVDTTTIGETINAAMYKVSATTDQKYDTYIYTTLDNAISAGANVYTFGTMTILKNTDLTGTPVGTTTSQNLFTISGTLVIGQKETDAVKETATFPGVPAKEASTAIVTAPSTTKLTISGSADVQNGQLKIAGLKSDSYSTKVLADVFMKDDTYGIYTDLATALGIAVSGDVVKVRSSAVSPLVLSKNATIASGVTLDASGKDITVSSGTTFTISGIIKVVNITVEPATTLKTAGILILDNYDKNSAISKITLSGIVTIGTNFDNSADSTSAISTDLEIKNATTAYPAAFNILGKLKYSGEITAVQTTSAGGSADPSAANGAVINGVISGELKFSGSFTSSLANVKFVGVISGTLTTSTVFWISEATVTGKVAVTSTGAFKVKSLLIVGTPATNLNTNSNTAQITAQLQSDVYAFVYGTPVDSTKIVIQDDSGVQIADKTTYYLNTDVVFATGYANSERTPVTKIADPEISGMLFYGWYKNAVLTTAVASDDYIGVVEKVYGKLEVKTVKVTVSPLLNGHWVINGDTITGGSNIELNESGNTIVFVADKDYKIEGTYTIYVGDKVMPADYVPQAGDVLSVTAEIVKDEKAAGMDLVTILLIIITIVIIIMAIIIALKLMRS